MTHIVRTSLPIRRRPIGRLVIAPPAIILALTAIGLFAAHSRRRDRNLDAPIVTQRINLNAASTPELQLLPGVGPAIAGRIVENRTRFGAFASLDHLTRVAGVGPRTILKLEPYVITAERPVDPAAPTDPSVH